MVLIPVQPSPLDVWGPRAVVELLAEAAMMRPALKSAFAVSRKIVNTAIGRDVADALAVYRMRVLAASLAQQVSFAEAQTTGQTVLETDPSEDSQCGGRGADAEKFWRSPVAKKCKIGHPRKSPPMTRGSVKSQGRGSVRAYEAADGGHSREQPSPGSSWAAWPTRARRWPTQSAHCWSSIGQQRKRPREERCPPRLKPVA